MAGSVFVSGGSGFVGSAVIDELLARGCAVSALLHSRRSPRQADRLQWIQGNLFQSSTLDAAMRDCHAVIHLVGIIQQKPSRGITFERIHVEGTQNVIDAARRAGIQRYIHMSAMGARADAASEYHRTKWQAEQRVRESGLEWTIFRPSLIWGEGGEFARMEHAWAKGTAAPYWFMPYFGSGLLGRGGAGRLQPLRVEDVARAFVDAMEKPQTIGQVYELGGPERLSWPEFHRKASEAMTGRQRRVLPIPAWYGRLLTRMAPEEWLPFNRDQVIMSQEDNVCAMEKFREDFGWEPGEVKFEFGAEK